MPAVAETASPIAHAIHRRMRELKLNQKNLAERAGLNEDYVRDILRGKSKRPQAGHLVAIADVLNCSIDDLFGVPPANARPVTSDLVDESEGRAFFGMLGVLPESERTDLLVSIYHRLRREDRIDVLSEFAERARKANIKPRRNDK